jgi:acetyl esterase/lipase
MIRLASSGSIVMHKLRILCLHGYHGSAEILRRQLRPLAAELGDRAELVCVDAPALAAGDFGWWHAVPVDAAPQERGTPGVPGPGSESRRHYKGWAATRDWIARLGVEHGPFDGVLGFSQGAALAALLVALCAFEPDGELARRAGFGFAIIAGGFASNDADHAAMLEVPGGIAVPSLHMIGRADSIVPSGASRALAARFRDPVIAEHDGGHVIAATPAVATAVRQFLDDRAAHAGHVQARSPQRPAARAAVPAAPIEVALWPGRARPVMRVYLPSEPAPRPALVIFRGGAYARNDGSGAGAGAWAASHGMVGVEVDYTTRATAPAARPAYADAARAVRLVRHRAAEWGVDPARVGVLGFSAGGHLASLLSTQPALPAPPDDDLAPRVSARPDLVILGYPVISFLDGYAAGAYVGSVDNWFGEPDPGEPLRRQFSNELHVAPSHPPVFLWTTADDALVPASHSELFAAACRRAGVPVELTIYPHGPHGMGLALDDPGDVGRWTQRLLDWLAPRWGLRGLR